jgi:UDP-glucose 4-epimerase
MKTYVVTGGCGFIGSHMVDKLVSLGNRVFVIDNLSAESNDFFYKNKSSNVVYYHSIDVSEIDQLTKVFTTIYESIDGSIDAVFHFAAESRIQPTIKDPRLAVKVNTVGTLNVLEMCKKFDVRRMVHSSTSSVYGNAKNNLPLIESGNLNPLNPYSISKACAENFCKMYYNFWGVDVVILRYFNVFGERQPLKGQYAPVVGKFIKQWENKEALTIVGSGDQRRDFTWVGDVVEANFIVAMTNFEIGGRIINVGTGENISILELAKEISDDIEFIPSRPGEAKETLASISLMEGLGWKPTIKIKDWLISRIGQKRFSTLDNIY